MTREKSSRNSGKVELKPMISASDTIDEASFKLRAIASPRWADTRESTLAATARRLGLSAYQAKRIAYREVKCIPAHVLENIRSLYAALEAKAERMVEVELKIQTALRRELDGNNAASMDPDGMAGGETSQPICPKSFDLEGEGGTHQEPTYPTQENDRD